jgi:hypothetical protein
MITIELDKEQSRKVTVEHIANTLIVQKQYLNDAQIARYRFMLNQFASLKELDVIVEQFDKTWPKDVTFY